MATCRLPSESLARGYPRDDEGREEGADGAERHVGEGVLVGGVELGAVPDERVPLAELPPEREQAAEPGDQQHLRPPRLELASR